MPELPEVEITSRKLRESGLEGLKISGPRGRKIKKVWRKGKVIFFDLSGKPPRILAIHLGMSGRIIFGRKNLINMPAYRHIRFSLNFSGGKKLIFNDPRKFGKTWYGDPKILFKGGYLGSLGPDMLSVSFEEFKKGLSVHKGAIKSVLLNQKVFSGIGNIIADEALWEAKIHPKTRVEYLDLKRKKSLYKAILAVLKRILRAGGTSMRDWGHPDNKSGGYQNEFRIYRQKRCPRCSLGVVKIKAAGRSSSICPRCQTK